MKKNTEKKTDIDKLNDLIEESKKISGVKEEVVIPKIKLNLNTNPTRPIKFMELLEEYLKSHVKNE